MPAESTLPQKLAIVDVADLQDVRDELRALRSEVTALRLVAQAAPARRLLSSRELAAAFGIGVTGVVRATAAGMPFEPVGSKRRYSLEDCRAWFAEHGARPLPVTHREVKAEDDPIDVSAVVSRSGLRRVGGGR